VQRMPVLLGMRCNLGASMCFSTVTMRTSIATYEPAGSQQPAKVHGMLVAMHMQPLHMAKASQMHNAHWACPLAKACYHPPPCTYITASTKLLRFISDDVWGSKGVCRVIFRSISAYLVQAWDVRNSCKHNGAVLPLSAAPVGRGADGVDAMA
jgi:hypothetical protein